MIDTVRKANGAKIRIITNGQLIEREIIPNLDVMGYFHISADACTAETYSKIRKGLSFDRLVDGVKKLVKEKGHGGIKIHNVINKYNYKEMPNIVKFWYDLGVDFVSFAQTRPRPYAHMAETCFNFYTDDDKDLLKTYIDKTLAICEKNSFNSSYLFPCINVYDIITY